MEAEEFTSILGQCVSVIHVTILVLACLVVCMKFRNRERNQGYPELYMYV